MNPFRDDVVRAELADLDPYVSPRHSALRRLAPTKKRHPLLAVVFVLCDLPFLVATSMLWGAIIIRVTAGGGPPPMPADPMERAGMIFGLVIVFIITLVFWLIPVLSLKELIQYARGR